MLHVTYSYHPFPHLYLAYRTWPASIEYTLLNCCSQGTRWSPYLDVYLDVFCKDRQSFVPC